MADEPKTISEQERDEKMRKFVEEDRKRRKAQHEAEEQAIPANKKPEE